jgi:hypothetical protein
MLGTGCGLDLGQGLSPDDGARVEPGGSEPERLAGMTDAHNAVRAATAASPPIPGLVWSEELADVAQAYATRIAGTCELVHSHGPYGENLALFGGRHADAAMVVNLWADEEKCWTFGPFMRGDECSADCDACGHYTQLVWRSTQLVGCGVADCPGSGQREIWVCNYDSPGNVIGRLAY